MASTIQLKRSALSGKVPNTGSLNLGELALNTYDGKIFFRRSGSTDSVQEVITTNTTNTGSVTITGTLTAASIVGSISASNGVVSGSSQVISILTSLNAFTASENTKSTTLGALTGSLATTGSNTFVGAQTFNSDITVLGAVNARQFNIGIISSSILYTSGSNKFGDTTDDTHQFTGSVTVTGSLYLNGTDLAAGGAQGTYVFPNAFDFNVDDTTFGDFNSASLGYNLNFGTVETVGSPIHFVGGLSNLGDTTVIYPTSRSIDFVVDDRYVASITSQSFYTNTTFTASLQQGYTWVGNSSGVSYAVATSSFGGALPSGVISGSSQLTSSYDSRYVLSGSITQTTWDNIASKPGGIVSGSSQVVGILSSLNTYTGSNDTTNTAQSTRLTTIESVTGSYETKGRGIVSGSSQITFSGISSLPTLVSGSSQITYANISYIPAGIVSGSTQTIANLPIGVISGSIQVLGGSGIISSSAQLNNASIENLTVINLTTVNETASVIFSSGSNRFGDFGNDTHSFTGSVQISGSLTTVGSSTATSFNGIINATNGVVSGSSQITYANISSIPSGIVSGSSQIIPLLPTGTVSGSSQTIGNLPTGTVSGSSQVVSILSSLNTYTGSQDTKNSTLASYTGSNDTKWTTLTNVTSSLISATGSYETKGRGIISGSSQVDVMSTTNIARLATTGSNSFNGNQTITGSLTIGPSTSTSPVNVYTSSANTFGTIAEFYNGDYTAGARTFIRVRNQISVGSTMSSYFGQGQDGKTYIIANNSARGGDIVIDGTNGNTTFAANVLPAANGTQDLGSSSYRWSTIYTSDLSLNNGIGDWTIVEGEDDLFLYNNKKGKVYKFALTEVDPSVATPKKS